MNDKIKDALELARIRLQAIEGTRLVGMEAWTRVSADEKALHQQLNAIEDALEDEPLPPPPPPDDDADALFLSIPSRLWSLTAASFPDDGSPLLDPFDGGVVAEEPSDDLPSAIGHKPAGIATVAGRKALRASKTPTNLQATAASPSQIDLSWDGVGWMTGQDAAPIRTLVLVAQWARHNGRYQKLAGADAEDSTRGGFTIGRTKEGDLEAWADDDATFAAMRCPVREERPVLHIIRFGERGLRLYCDGLERTVEYAQDIVPFTSRIALLAGFWQHEVVDPADAWLLDAHGFEEEISDEAVEKIVEHYRELAPPRADEPGNGNGGNGPPPGPHPDEIPPASGPTIEVKSESDVNKAPPDANLIFRPGTYRLSNVRAKHGQVWRAPEGATIDGGGARFLVNATGSRAAEGVAMIGFEVAGFDASPSGLNDKHRMNDETGTIHLEHDICRDWKFRDMHFRDLGKAAVRISGRIDMRRILLTDVEGAAISGHTYDAIFEDITGRRINQERRAHTHHHSGLIKLTGGQQSDHNGPPRQNIVLRRVQAFDVYGRGLVWVDWNVRRVAIEDCLVDGTEKEGITLEAMEGGIVRRCVIKGRKRKHKTPAEWNAAIMLQNARECIIEEVEIWDAPGLDAAVGVAHHNRHNMSGPTIGRFTGTDNVFRNSRVQNGIQHVLYQGVVDVAPGRGTVLASNKSHGITRF